MSSEQTRPDVEIPFIGRWHYSRTELIADGIVHVVGIVLAIVAGSVMLALAAPKVGSGVYLAAIFYVLALLTVFSISLAYNLWPVASPVKWLLRRFDHSAIYLLIAATYTPFLAQLPSPKGGWTIAMIWLAAIAGMVVKIILPGRFDRLAIAFYLAIGWSGLMLASPLMALLTPAAVALLLAGGIVYSCGVVFFVWKGLRFHTALWHGFVVAGASLHLAAMFDCLVIARL